MVINKDWVMKLISKVKANRKLELGIYAGLILIVLILYFVSANPRETASSQQAETSFENVFLSEHEVEQRLEQALSAIRGAGRVEVMVTYETGPEIVPAMNTDFQENSTQNGSGSVESTSKSTKPATIAKSGANEPIVLTERQPTIRGVIVIAEGAADISVQMDLERAAKTVLGVSLDCIEIFEMTAAE